MSVDTEIRSDEENETVKTNWTLTTSLLSEYYQVRILLCWKFCLLKVFIQCAVSQVIELMFDLVHLLQNN